jgi:hypothetical protein
VQIVDDLDCILTVLAEHVSDTDDFDMVKVKLAIAGLSTDEAVEMLRGVVVPWVRCSPATLTVTARWHGRPGARVCGAAQLIFSTSSIGLTRHRE